MYLLDARPRTAPAGHRSNRIFVGGWSRRRGGLGGSADRLGRRISRLTLVVALSVAEEEIGADESLGTAGGVERERQLTPRLPILNPHTDRIRRWSLGCLQEVQIRLRLKGEADQLTVELVSLEMIRPRECWGGGRNGSA